MLAPVTRAGSGASKSGSIRTVPVNQSARPFPEGREQFRLMSICLLLSPDSNQRKELGDMRLLEDALFEWQAAEAPQRSASREWSIASRQRASPNALMPQSRDVAQHVATSSRCTLLR